MTVLGTSLHSFAAEAVALFFMNTPLQFAAIVILLMAFAQRRVTQQRSLLSMLALATEKNIPLPDSIEAFARDQGGRFGYLAQVFAKDLRSGMPFAIAVRRNPGVLPHGTELAAQAGYACGKLGPALRDQAQRYRQAGGLRQVLVTRFPYFCVVLLVAPFIVTFMMFKIAPSFEKIFSDFDVELPPITRLVFSILHQPLMMATGFLAVLLAPVMALAGVLWYIGWLRALPPGVDRLFARFDRARILRALSYPAELRMPLEPTLERLSIDYPRGWVRRRLARVSAMVSSGAPWIASLERQRLIGRVDGAVLEAAERVGNLPWALREMADSNERRLLYRLELGLQLGSVLLVGLFGFAVFVFVVGFFMPLVKLIWSLSL